MAHNKAYRLARNRQGGDPDGRLLRAFQDRFRQYRLDWRGQPRAAIAAIRAGADVRAAAPIPLCIDVDVAAVCDLACGFCYRQHIATPDKIMPFDLFRDLADQVGELGVPSMKLVWRGEPLLHPKLPEMVAYAKERGVLEVIVTTNATRLDERASRELIEAGLDLLTYSFDGGTRETYERMRVGRFHDNRFDVVYGNIRRFAEIRTEKGAVFPRTKIQMILTEETFGEQSAFFDLFDDCVDDVAVKAYTERGGGLKDLDTEARARVMAAARAHGIEGDPEYWRDMDGHLFLSRRRLPCEQPFQRLMITQDGRAAMCCYDWGSEHPVGYVHEQGYRNGYAENEAVLKAVKQGRRGFSEFMADAVLPQQKVRPPEQVDRLIDIWHGETISAARRLHAEGRVEDVAICARCPFKETYDWVPVPAAVVAEAGC